MSLHQFVTPGHASREKLFLLALGIAAVAVGAFCGYAVRERWLAPYTASSEILLPDPAASDGPMFGFAAFKAAEPLIRSRTVLEQFAAVRGISDDPAISQFADQLFRGKNEPVHIELAFPLTLLSTKGLPEAVTNALLKQRRNVDPSVRVEVTDGDPVAASRKQELILEYVRDTLLRSALLRWIEEVRGEAQIESANTAVDKANLQAKLSSLTRRIENMTAISTAHQQLSESDRPKQGGLAGESIQVPTNKTEFLSPERQLIALQTDRASTTEQFRLAENRLAMAAAEGEYAESLSKRVQQNPRSRDLLDDAIARASAIKTDSDNPDVRNVLDQLRAKLLQQLVLLRQSYVETTPRPAEPLLYRTGPGQTVSMASGAFLGLIAWLMLVRLYSAGALRRQQGVVALNPRAGSVRDAASVRAAVETLRAEPVASVDQSR